MSSASPRLTRRHAPPINGTNNDSNNNNGNASEPTGLPKYHNPYRKHLTNKLIAVAALSFIIGIVFTNPTASRVEPGFEPPRLKKDRKPLNVKLNDKNVNTKPNDNNNGNAPAHPPPNTRIPTPRLIALHPTMQTYHISSPPLPSSSDTIPSIPLEGPQISPSWYDANAIQFMDGFNYEKCVPMAKWQHEMFLDCNKFHELELDKMRMINRGGSRIAFELNTILPLAKTPYKFVYKTTKYSSDIEPYRIEEQRKDALIMERTTSSPFIPSIHGYCSLAVMMDFMPEGNMHDYIKGSRILSRKVNGAHGVEDTSGKLLKPVDRLKVGIHIATSVADLHGIDGTKIPSYFHNDICCHQFLFQNGLFKLNDFNYARPIYLDKSTKTACTRESYGMLHWKGRSLEEHIKALKLPFDPPTPDKIDVWMMGNVIYYILTDLYTFERPENLNNHEVGKLLVAGKRSPYPEYIEHSQDPSHIAVKKALDMCWVQNWRERPSAREISEFMLGELRKITGEEEPDLRVVLPERDPNQKPSDGEYSVFND